MKADMYEGEVDASEYGNEEPRVPYFDSLFILPLYSKHDADGLEGEPLFDRGTDSGLQSI
ncbi:MAG: hypothetical protein ACR2RL_26385 [Gammaproteobacteria bacterium]